MQTFLNRLHARVGDLWWYSAMIFIACRSGDVIQAFIGLWLVPKYVGPNELGAVLPLQQLASLFTVPLAIVAVVFSKYVNTYATRGEYGKVKSFIHDVILISAALFLVCIAAAYILIPHFYERLNVSAGSLTVLVLAAGFAANVSNLFSSALQGLKKFKTMTAQNLIAAPIRLVTLLVTMPIRALSGYLLGQTTPSVACGILAFLSIRRDLSGVRSDASWRKDIPDIWKYMWPVALYTTFSLLVSTILLTVYKQRLPASDSAAYYLFSRFADISAYVGFAMTTVMFPMAAEAHENGHETPRVLQYTILGTLCSGGILAVLFALGGDGLLSLNDTWSHYRPFVRNLPLMTLSTVLSVMTGCIVNYEMACRRFRPVFVTTVLQGLFAAFVVAFTGYEFFRGILPDDIVNAMRDLNLGNLSTMTNAGLISAAIQLAVLAVLCRSIWPAKAKPNQRR